MYSIATKMTQLLISTTDLKTNGSKAPTTTTGGRAAAQTSSAPSPKSPATSSYKSVSDDNEQFFDAVDNNNNNNSNGVVNSSGGGCVPVPLRRDESYEDDDDEYDDEDDRGSSCFFDTVTSRHQSESNSNMNTPLSPRQFHLSESCFDEEELVSNNQEQPALSNAMSTEKSNQTSNETNNNKLESIIDDDEEEDDSDQTDAELETPWSFWIDSCARGTSKDEYEAGIKLIQTVKTVQTFWSIVNNIPDVSRLPINYNYHLMRDTRRPLWEDAENSRGGLWKFKCKRDDTSLVWIEAMMAAIGEQLSDCVSRKDEVIGISVGRRDRDDIVQIWNRDARYACDASIVDKIHKLVPQVKFSVVFYKAHDFYSNDVSSSSSSSSPHHHHHNGGHSKSNGHHHHNHHQQQSSKQNHNSNSHHHNHLSPYHSTNGNSNSPSLSSSSSPHHSGKQHNAGGRSK